MQEEKKKESVPLDLQLFDDRSFANKSILYKTYDSIWWLQFNLIWICIFLCLAQIDLCLRFISPISFSSNFILNGAHRFRALPICCYRKHDVFYSFLSGVVFVQQIAFLVTRAFSHPIQTMFVSTYVLCTSFKYREWVWHWTELYTECV